MAIVTYRQALHDTLREEMQRDQSVVLLGEEIGKFEGSYKITAGLLKEFGPERVMDTPIAEEGFVGAAIGAAMLGLRPVVEIMTVNFSLLAIDQIVNHAAKIHYMFGGQARVPMVLRTPEGGGQQLAATHSQNFSSWYAYIPGLKVVAPATPADARGLLKSSIRDDDPVIFLENLALYNTKGEVPDMGGQNGQNGPDGAQGEERLVPIGTAAIMRQGNDLTLVSYSRMSVVALEVARRLEQDQGISCEVIDVRSLRPLDRTTIIESVKKTSRAVIIEEDWYSYGVGAELSATIHEGAFDYLDAPVRRVAQAEVPLPYAKVMEQAALPKAQSLVEAIKATLDASGYRGRKTTVNG
jgi:pyruvate dehydrogenase E1 component beta subunit